jgi:hypothetical protein
MYPKAALLCCSGQVQYASHLVPKICLRCSHLHVLCSLAAQSLLSLHATNTQWSLAPQLLRSCSSNPEDSGSSRPTAQAHPAPCLVTTQARPEDGKNRTVPVNVLL